MKYWKKFKRSTKLGKNKSRRNKKLIRNKKITHTSFSPTASNSQYLQANFSSLNYIDEDDITLFPSSMIVFDDDVDSIVNLYNQKETDLKIENMKNENFEK